MLLRLHLPPSPLVDVTIANLPSKRHYKREGHASKTCRGERSLKAGKHCYAVIDSHTVGGVPVLSGAAASVQAAFLTYAMGGADRYAGNANMTSAHARLVREQGMTMQHFDVVLEHFGAALSDLDVPGVRRRCRRLSRRHACARACLVHQGR